MRTIGTLLVLIAPRKGTQLARLAPLCFECGRRCSAYTDTETTLRTSLFCCVDGPVIVRCRLPGFSVFRRWHRFNTDVHYAQEANGAVLCGFEVSEAYRTSEYKNTTCNGCKHAWFSAGKRSHDLR